MTNITSLSTYAEAHPRPLSTAAPQQSGNTAPRTITLQQAIATNANPAALRAVADWNERKSYDERRRKARSRHKAQCVALRGVAEQLERGQVREAA